jgi:glycosyltransferase involved in cell wall biosynthesis
VRVLHVVTLAGSDGAFGGPLTVARGQVAELAERGHDALLVAGARARDVPVRDARVRTFRARQVVPGAGFSGLASPAMLRWLWRHARTYDVAHVHLGRDLVTLLAAFVLLVRRVPYVTQTHGMVPPDRRPRARVLDALLTRRVLRGARVRYVLTDRESADLPRVVPGRVTRLGNGVRLPDVTAAPGPDPEVLFCARLHPRKRPVAFVELAAAVRAAGVPARFALVGPDEGELPAVRARIAALGLGGLVTVEGALPPDAVAARVARATVYVLPSVDEPFPMSLVEAMALGVPSVCTTSCGIAGLLRELDAAVVAEPDVASLAVAVLGLLADDARRAALGARARAAVAAQFSVAAVADALERDYAAATRTP